jgi:hypothetical protein
MHLYLKSPLVLKLQCFVVRIYNSDADVIPVVVTIFSVRNISSVQMKANIMADHKNDNQDKSAKPGQPSTPKVPQQQAAGKPASAPNAPAGTPQTK